jgi:hypothetical protein
MADATLSPRELANLLSRLDDAQRMMDAVREQVIRAMAARRKGTPTPAAKTPVARRRNGRARR